MNIFVYRPGAIGDTILTLPAIAAIRNRFPGCHVTFAGNDACLPLLPVDQALSADDLRLLPMFSEPPRTWRPFDLHLIFARQPMGLQPSVQRDPIEAVAHGSHMADWLVDGIDPAFPDRTPRLQLPEANVNRQQTKLVLHPGAGSPTKRWPAELFANLASALLLEPTIVTGPADDDLGSLVASRLDRPAQLWDNLPLPELAARLAGTRLFVGNDSGITHLAAALGVPTLALYLTTDPLIWGIRGKNTRRLATGSFEQALVLCTELLSDIPGGNGDEPP